MNKSVFRNKEERLKWQKERFLTAGKLIEWLSKFPPDTIIYEMEGNTGTYQEISRLENTFKSRKDAEKDLKENLIHWFGGNSPKVKTELKETFRYVEDKNGIILMS